VPAGKDKGALAPLPFLLAVKNSMFFEFLWKIVSLYILGAF